MQGQTVRIVSQAIRYIEEHLHEKMDLDMVASALHYSKYHLHRIFTKTVDLTIHDYGFSPDTGSIDFLAVHPQYRHLGITKLFLDKLAEELLCGKEITLTTYRAGDKADTGYREEYRRLGFAERELLVEYGYPTQRFVLPPKNKEETKNDRNTEEPVSREL